MSGRYKKLFAVFVSGFFFLLPIQAYATSGSVLFQAIMESDTPAVPGTNIPFSGTYNIGDGWRDNEHKFVAPVFGYYHFDITVELSKDETRQGCRYLVEVGNLYGGSVQRSYPLFTLGKFETNVANTPNTFNWRRSGFMLTGNGGLDLFMRDGDEMSVKLIALGNGCYDDVNILGKTGNTRFKSHMSGHLILSVDDVVPVSASSGAGATNPTEATPPTTTDPVTSSDPVDTKTYDVQLVACDGNKIKTIKLIRKVTNKSLKQAKAMLAALPVVLASGTSADEAKALNRTFKKAGCETKAISSR